MDEVDKALARAWAIFDEDLSDKTDIELGALLPQLVAAGYVAIDGETPSGHFWRFTPAGVERANELKLDVPWTPPPPSFHEFLDRVLSQIPEFRPIADEQLELADGEYYSTRFFDAFSDAVMACQYRRMQGTGTAKDDETVRHWLALGEDAMSDRYVATAFLETAGDDLLFDPRGQALHDDLGPRLRAALNQRRADMEERRRGQHGA